MKKPEMINRVRFILKNQRTYEGIVCIGIIGLIGVSQTVVSAYENKIKAVKELLANQDYLECLQNSKTPNLTLEEYINNQKEQFHEKYGSENQFQTIFEDEIIKEEVNGATGVFRYTNKVTGDTNEVNYLEDLEQHLEFLKMTLEEQVNYQKEQFHKKYGTDNEFQTIFEDENIKEEVNGATGTLKHTDKVTGKVNEMNYLEELTQHLEVSKMTLEEQINYQKEQLHKKYGTSNQFQTIFEDRDIKVEVNGATSVLRYTDKLTGDVEEVNYLEELMSLEGEVSLEKFKF